MTRVIRGLRATLNGPVTKPLAAIQIRGHGFGYQATEQRHRPTPIFFHSPLSGDAITEGSKASHCSLVNGLPCRQHAGTHFVLLADAADFRAGQSHLWASKESDPATAVFAGGIWGKRPAPSLALRRGAARLGGVRTERRGLGMDLEVHFGSSSGFLVVHGRPRRPEGKGWL